ncbi:putative manganese-dependent inorganic diphosphatase [Adlercreutzia murintestinalis]|uniref:putative manganese-dependent inorganic diphosphatase n=1 Tax=Adlercreutzia murintestinalis TaxID=2941325 RepID=UPI00203DE88A|nr:putative manganese-dependent inorganic diphosphatase [Adlercreutzia murintestinalis]
MAKTILVVGHKNPDNDSISSAVGYAYLKTQMVAREGRAHEVEYVPARLGKMPPESAWILEQNGIAAPRVIKHVHVRVRDVMTPDPVSISADDTMLQAGRLLKKHNVRSLAVEDADGRFLGLISTRAIAERYISATDALEEGDPASSMAVASSLIDSLNQKVSELMATNVFVLDEEDLVKDSVEDLIASELREGIVLDDDGRAIGIVTRSDVTTYPKRQVILVDHNETLQAAPGIEDADVVEIIDHHRIADVSTANPIQFLNLPLGSTATIITLEFRRHSIEIPPPIAAVLLSAIMTDTVILKSPTATDIDREQAEYLGAIIGRDVTEFGLEVFKTRGGENNMSAKDLVEADSKEFHSGDDTLLIAQRETVDLAGVMEREAEIRAHLRKLIADRGYAMVLLMVTDIMAEGSQFIIEGNTRIAEKAFGIEVQPEGGNWMPGVLSRKKQVAARILN